MSCGRSMWLMLVSKLELWLVSLTVLFALVSGVMRTRVEYDEEQYCLSVCWIMVQLPVVMCAPSIWRPTGLSFVRWMLWKNLHVAVEILLLADYTVYKQS
ncbi:hypothetical protein DER46DRAFT_609803 [Fusarium sp. MPI-SDFR-AT-0072]|nr:hypothetical protein DER46DRAFT_609803 [Fusarium sp. MPI-SDFR-AT-0072]